MNNRAGLGKSIGLVLAGMLVVAIPLAGAAFLGWVDWRGEVKISGDITKTLPRPGGGVAALLVRQDSWDHYVDRVYIREDDGSLDSIFGSYGDYQGPPSIEWKNPGALLIRMKCGDIHEYQNLFYYKLNGDLKRGSVELEGKVLACPDADLDGKR